MPWATIKGNRLITTQFISYCQFISPETHRGAREAVLTRNTNWLHITGREAHAFWWYASIVPLSDHKPRPGAIFMYKQLSLASLATLRAFRQSIKVFPVPVVSGQRNCFSSGKHIFTEYLQSKSQLMCVYNAAARTQQHWLDDPLAIRWRNKYRYITR